DSDDRQAELSVRRSWVARCRAPPVDTPAVPTPAGTSSRLWPGLPRRARDDTPAARRPVASVSKRPSPAPWAQRADDGRTVERASPQAYFGSWTASTSADA